MSFLVTESLCALAFPDVVVVVMYLGYGQVHHLLWGWNGRNPLKLVSFSHGIHFIYFISPSILLVDDSGFRPIGEVSLGSHWLWLRQVGRCNTQWSAEVPGSKKVAGGALI